MSMRKRKQCMVHEKENEETVHGCMRMRMKKQCRCMSMRKRKQCIVHENENEETVHGA